VDGSFLKSKFDNICLIIVIMFLIGLLTWVDKHGNSDYEKWLEVFIAGFGGAYLGLITAARQAWEKKTQDINPTGTHKVTVTETGTSADPTAK
jgi:hypothetical protein